MSEIETKKEIKKFNFETANLKETVVSNWFYENVKKALPTDLNAKKIIRAVLTEIANNPNLEKCEKEEVLKCVFLTSQLGLELGMLGNVYLIPYGGKCKMIIGYKGMIELITRSGRVSGIRAYVVDTADFFEFEYGLEPKIIHKPAEVKDGVMKYVYAIVDMKDGSRYFEVMTKEEVDKIRKTVSFNKVWDSHYNEMAKKTAIRRLFKYLPISQEMSKAVALEERQDEAGVDFTKEIVLDYNDYESLGE